MREPPSGPLRADPETVAAARDATLASLAALSRGTIRVGRALAQGLVVGGRWTWPHLRRAVIGLASMAKRATTSALRWGWTRRVALARVGHRLLWWTALVLLVLVGRALLGEGASPGDELWVGSMLTWFVLGLGLAGVVLLTAPETRMRRAAFALAASHGALALLVWFAGA